MRTVKIKITTEGLGRMKPFLSRLLKRCTDGDAECTEDGRDGRNTLEGTEHGKGAEVWNEVRKRGDAEHIT